MNLDQLPEPRPPSVGEAPHAAHSGLEAAMAYVRAGLSVIPIRADGSKSPVGKWKESQGIRATEVDVVRWINVGLGVAVVCGEVSELEVLDFDAPDVFERWRELVETEHPGALERAAIIQSPRADWARHVYLHRTKPHGNQKLAERWACDSSGELRLNDKGKPWTETLIETRGEGGYVLAPGCPPQCHPTGRTYRHIGGLTIADVRKAAPLSDELYASFVNVARSFTEIASDDPVRNKDAKRVAATKLGTRPGDDFNRRASWVEILEPHGWQIVQGDGVSYTTWRRPGKERGVSATTGYCSTPQSGDLIRVFSSNAGLEVGAHSKFGVFAKLNHGGEFSRAARALAQNGYGDMPRRSRSSSTSSGASVDKPDADVTSLGDDGSIPHFPPLTDTGNAERLVRTFGARIRHCHPWKKWYLWDKTRWRHDDRGRVMALSKRVARTLFQEAGSIDDEAVRRSTIEWALKSEKAERRKAMVDLARSEHGIPVVPAEFDTNRWLLNCANLTVDLRTGEVYAHRQTDLITKFCPTNFVPGAKCPLWDAFLERVLPDDEVRAYVQRFCGLCLTGEVGENILLFLLGEGANGKTTAVRVIQEVVSPSYAIQISPELLTAKAQRNHPTEVADLFGVRLAVGSETSNQQELDVAFVKQLTGGDRLRARRMREDFWEFDPTHKIAIVTNHLPRFPRLDYALRRRIHVVPFEVTIPVGERDPHLLSKLLAEREGILAWMFEGCRLWREQGLNPPEQVTLTTPPEAVSPSDTFVVEQIVSKPGARISAADLLAAHNSWCAPRNFAAANQAVLGAAMGRAGHRSKKSHGYTVYFDIELRGGVESRGGPLGTVGDPFSVNHLERSHEEANSKRVPKAPQGSPSLTGDPENAVFGVAETVQTELEIEWGEQ